jgi:hypothetical protein
MAAPYNAAPPTGAQAAQAMIAQNVPLDLVQQVKYQAPAGSPSGILQAGGQAPMGMPPGSLTPPGVPGMPGMPSQGRPIPGAVASVGALTGGAAAACPFPISRTEVRFAGPTGMKVSWYTPGPDGKNTFVGSPIEVPGRYNFVQASIYRLKLSDIPNRPGLELYPTLEVVPANARTAAFLAHSAVPLTFTEEDLEQVTSGNYVVKVIYLPDPQFQELATTGPEEIISSRLEPGVDPIAQAHARGSILLIVRLGNIDLEAPNTPAMDAPNPYQMKPAIPHAAASPGGMGPGGSGPVPMMPYGASGPGRPMMMPPSPGMMPGGGMMLPPVSGPGMPGVSATPGGAPSGPTAMRPPQPSDVQAVQYKGTPGGSVTPASLAGQSSLTK